MNNSLSFKVLKVLEKAPEQSQRSLSERCGGSLGSIHYCLKALIDKGYVKALNFKTAQNKLAYAYILTPSGLNRKRELALTFLRLKQGEYKALQREIMELKGDLTVDDVECSSSNQAKWALGHLPDNGI
jgi:EPS-associated MarR family transcriptional regulator